MRSPESQKSAFICVRIILLIYFCSRVWMLICLFRLSSHVRGSFKNHPFTEYQDRGMEVRQNFRRCKGFDATLCPNGPLGFPFNHDHSSIDFPPKKPFFTDNDHSLPADFAGKFSVDPDRSFKGQFPFEFRSLAEKGFDLLTGVFLLFQTIPPFQRSYLRRSSRIRSSSSRE